MLDGPSNEIINGTPHIEALPADRIDVRPVLPFLLSESRQNLLQPLLKGDVKSALSQSEALEDLALTAYINKILSGVDHVLIDSAFLEVEPYSTLTTQRSFEANPYWPQIHEGLTKLVKQHHLQDGTSPVIGLTLFGSEAKGYWIPPDSDLDGRLITKTRTPEELGAVEQVNSTLRSLFPSRSGSDVDHAYPEYMSRIVSAGKNNWLLTGLFVGDYQRLQALQREYIEKMRSKSNGDQEWTRDQRYIAEQGIGIDKLFERWNDEWQKKYGVPILDDDQKSLLRAVTAVQKVPPSLKEVSI